MLKRAGRAATLLAAFALAACATTAATKTDQSSLAAAREEAYSAAVEECSRDNVEGAATLALAMSGADMEMNGYARTSPNVVKGVYYAALGDVFSASSMFRSTMFFNPCAELSNQVTALAVRYLQDAYDNNERLYVTSRGNNRRQLMALLVRTGAGIIPPDSAKYLELQ